MSGPAMLSLLCFIGAGCALAAFLAVRNSDPNRITRSERKELFKAQDLIDDLAILASEHSTLGDPFATLALDKITRFRKEMR